MRIDFLCSPAQCRNQMKAITRSEQNIAAKGEIDLGSSLNYLLIDRDPGPHPTQIIMKKLAHRVLKLFSAPSSCSPVMMEDRHQFNSNQITTYHKIVVGKLVSDCFAMFFPNIEFRHCRCVANAQD